jgi:hypothetical protein
MDQRAGAMTVTKEKVVNGLYQASVGFLLVLGALFVVAFGLLAWLTTMDN